MYDLFISKDCIYVTIIKYMYFYNDCEIHFSLTVTASFILLIHLKSFEYVTKSHTIFYVGLGPAMDRIQVEIEYWGI